MGPDQQNEQPRKVPRDVRAVRLVEALLEQKAIELFVDVTLQPRIVIAEDPHENNWSLEDSRVRDWLAEQFWESKEEVLLDREIDRVLAVIRGKARRQQESRSAHDQRLIEILEKYPVVEIIIEFMASKTGRYRRTGEEFFSELKRFAEKRGFLNRNRKTFPGSANRLTRTLNLYVCTHCLEQLGIRYIAAHRESSGRRLVELEKIAEGSPVLSSCQPSGPNLANSETLVLAPSAADEKAARLETLKRRRLCSTSTSSSEGVNHGETMDTVQLSVLDTETVGPNSRQLPSEKVAPEPGTNVPVQSSKPVEDAAAGGNGRVPLRKNDGSDVSCQMPDLQSPSSGDIEPV